MSVDGYWGITYENGKYRGQLRFNGGKLHTGRYATVLEAVKALDRLITTPPPISARSALNPG